MGCGSCLEKQTHDIQAVSESVLQVFKYSHVHTQPRAARVRVMCFCSTQDAPEGDVRGATRRSIMSYPAALPGSINRAPDS